jgi:hypothetical protein
MLFQKNAKTNVDFSIGRHYVRPKTSIDACEGRTKKSVSAWQKNATKMVFKALFIV